MELNSQQIQNILKRFPQFEASYETILHKNLPTNDKYNIGLAIPFGKKYYIWFSYYQDKNVCFLMELNRDKKIIRISIKDCNVCITLALGTLLYVSCLEHEHTVKGEEREKYFIEDIYYYRGLSMDKIFYSDRLGYIEDFFKNYRNPKGMEIYLPEMWWITDPVPKPLYAVHHIQYRCLNINSPFLNQTKKTVCKVSEERTKGSEPSLPCVIESKKPNINMVSFKANYKKPQYKLSAVFVISADIKFDIYHLYACGKNMKNEYYGIAGIPTYKTSIFMNSLFRKIRENEILDYIEESEDEEEFENIKEDKYVDLKKKLLMECIFHPKFKKWIPIKVVNDNYRIVHINKL